MTQTTEKPITALVDAPVVPLRHPGRWVTAGVLLLLAAMFVHALVTNPRFGWDVVGEYLFDPSILAGLGRTLALTAAGMAIGVSLGAALAVMRLSSNPVLSVFAKTYIWFFRGTPLLVQLIFWYNLSALWSTLSLGIPFGQAFVEVPTNQVFTIWVAAIVAFGLNEAAYMSEIVRGGLMSVDPGQSEAARTLGMTESLTLRRVILPQALRMILPPTGNQLIGMLKYTSLVSVIAMPDLLYASQMIYSVNYETIPLLMVASIWYLVVTTIATFAQSLLEKRLGRGFTARSTKTRRTKANAAPEPGAGDTEGNAR